ncbi:penicillin amidase or penicillin acylase [Leptospira ryugenii]|uniref:Penicillin amidase or penicillin acylase n=2 Tax=Leptospira ryugenii TaxID=1917863 RepID=A0A2P2E168_9LEPT|nr:penicillin amidase or penicillin acylase [Leptospira ryugenii]
MEVQKRVGLGTLSELFGDKLIESDQFLKTLLLKKRAEEYVNQQKHISPEAWVHLDSFLSGINAFVDEGVYPIEFTILGTKPGHFDRVDAIAFLYYMGFSFAEGIKSDSLFTILESELKNRNVKELFPRYDLETEAVTIIESQPGSPKLAYKPSLSPEDSKSQKAFTKNNLNQLFTLSKAIQDLKLPIEPLEGSNSWLIAPSRSQSGGAILANDPHIALSNPGTWYEAHLQYPGFETYGYFLSIVPFPLIAHNRDKAWGLTMLEQDDVNLYFETIENGKYLAKGKWLALDIYKDDIKKKDGTTQPFQVEITNHGPIVTKLIKAYTGRPVSLFWANHHLDNPILDVLFLLGKASSVKEMDDASSLISAPGLNFSYADVKGNIAYYSVGRFPILKSGNPRKILEGSTGESDVIGYVASANNPKLKNPANGIIITANNQVTKAKLPGLNSVEGNWQPADRFLRLADVLGRQAKWSVEELSDLQNDTFSSFAPTYLEIILPHLKTQKDPLKVAALELLTKWDHTHGPESKGAVVYDVLYYNVLKRLLRDELGSEKFLIYGEIAEYWNAYRGFMRNPNSDFWDDLGTPDKKETQAEIFQLAFEDTVDFLRKEVSSSPSLWTWGRLYKIRHPHPLGVVPLIGKIFEIGPMPAAGGAEVVNNLKHKLMKEDWVAASGPSKRRVIDYGNLDSSVTQLPIGNSGNLASPYYGNLVKDYNEGNARQILLEESKWTKVKKMEFLPSP